MFDPDGAISREYLLERGYCCHNGCRNCPYGFTPGPVVPPGPDADDYLPDGGPAQRIVSLCPTNTEILAALDLLPRVTAVDDGSDWPPEVACLPRVGPERAVDLDRVAALAPDLVVASLLHPAMASTVIGLRDRCMPHVVLEPRSLEDLWENLRRVGRAAGVEDRAEQLALNLQARVACARARIGGAASRPRLYWEWWPKPLYAPGRDHWLTLLSELAGGVSVTAELEAETVAPASETIIAADPEWILLVWNGIARRKVRPEVIRRRPGWEQITAVRENRIHVLEEALYTRPSPRLVEALERLVELIHPARVPHLPAPEW